ncbi:MAG: argS [Candidatus Midichloriaceae bacterium]|jgi:arginyl-tRNA synthetase|nr:argS [Candidatus Midichloriaceae bacterium]
MKKELICNVFDYIKEQIRSAASASCDFSNVVVELPKEKSNGDFSTNAAMVLSAQLKNAPRVIAENIKANLSTNPYFSSVEIAGPGFINIRVVPNFWHDFIKGMYENLDNFGKSNAGLGKKVLIEFVSTNPTGPMHVGHSRGAVYGDALANLLKASGFEVVKEYYINDAGNQIEVLTRSLYTRYQQLFGIDAEIGEGMYPGDYLVDVAKEVKLEHGDSFLNKDFNDIYEDLSAIAVTKIMNIIRADLKVLGVEHDSFVSELNDLRKKGYIKKAIDLLKEKGLLYIGKLDAPKGLEQEDWEAKEQLIFKSTEFGDDVDRAVQRSDGSYTYFAGDFGLALQRMDRGFKEVVLVLGADHIGFTKRLKAVTKALSNGESSIDIPITQMVNLFKGGAPFKMSKRSGHFITAADVVEEVGVDALRFVLLSRKNDTIIDFDFDKVKEKTKDNPVFYVQYAHARCSSVLRNAESELEFKPDLNEIGLLKTASDGDLIRKVSLFPKIVEQAALHHEPHRIIYYAIELATEFHSLWAKGNDDEDLRFIIPDNPKLSSARLVLVDMVKNTIKAALKVLGITAVDKM